MIRRIFSFFLILVTLFQVMGKSMVYVEYAFNIRFISEQLCINKAKPGMHCQGRCYLKKQMDKQEQSNRAATSDKGAVDLQWFVEGNSDQLTPPGTRHFHQFEYRDTVSFFLARAVFHPPAAC